MGGAGGGVLCMSSRQIGFSCSLLRKGSVMVPFGKCVLLWNGTVQNKTHAASTAFTGSACWDFCLFVCLLFFGC